MKRFFIIAMMLATQAQAQNYVCEQGTSKLSFTVGDSTISGKLTTFKGTRAESMVSFSGYSHPSAQTPTRVPTWFKPQLFNVVDSWGTAGKVTLTNNRVVSATFESEGQILSFSCYNDIQIQPLPPVQDPHPNCPRCGDADFL